MNAGTLVCWKRDGTPKVVRVLTAAGRALSELECSADVLAEAREALESQADNIEWRDNLTAEALRTIAARCRWQERDARALIAEQAAEAA